MMSMMARAIRTKPTLPVPPWASVQVANTEAEKAKATNQYVNFVKGSPDGVRMADAEKALVEMWCSTIVNDLATKKDQFPRAEHGTRERGFQRIVPSNPESVFRD